MRTRKVVLGLLMAATAAVPVALQAQERPARPDRPDRGA